MRRTAVAVAAGIALAVGGAGWLFWQSTATRDGELGAESGREEAAQLKDGPELTGRRVAKVNDPALDEGRFEIPGVVEDEEGRARAGIVVEARFRRPPADPAEEDAQDEEAMFGPEFGLKEALGEEPPYATATSLPDGTFALVVRRRGDFALIAKPEPPLVGLEQEVSVTREPGKRVTLKVVRGSVLKGRVVDAADRGLDAILWATWDGDAGSWHPAAVATAAGTGAFAFSAVPAGEVTLRILLPGRLMFDVATKTPRAEEWLIRLGAFAPLLAGTVRDLEGRPIAGARVGVSLAPTPNVLDGGDPECLALTDGDGRYRIEGPFTGPVTKVRAEATGFLSFSEEPPVARWSGLVLAAGKEAALDLTLWRGGTLAGTVRERGSGTPLPGATVWVLPQAVDGRMRGTADKRAVSDAEGRYTVSGVSVGRSILIVRHATHYFAPFEALPRPTGGEADLDVATYPEPPPAMSVFLAREGERLARDIELERGLEVAGRVVDAAGAPVADAEVHAPAQDPCFVGVDEITLPWRRALGRSAADGRFLATGIAPRPDCTLYAEKTGFLGEPCAPFALRSGAPAPELTLRLLGGATIVGHVVDASGSGCAGVDVNAWMGESTGGLVGSESSHALSGPEGTFRMEHLHPGTAELNASHANLGSGSTTVEDLTVGEQRDGIVITLAPRTSVTVSGVLVDEQGVPARGKSLHAVQSAGGSSHSYFISADRHGRFSIDVEAPGPVRFLSYGGRSAELAVVDAPAEDVRIVWKEPPSLVVEGLVTDASGRAVPLCRVNVQAESGGGNACGGGGSARFEGSAVVHGWFRHHVAGAAPIQVKVADARDGDGRRLNLKDKTVTLAEAPAGPLTIALEAGLVVSGRVVDGAGGPLEGVGVQSGQVHASTDRDGAFRLAGLAEESVTVTCHPAPPWITPKAQAATAGTEDVVFRLKQGLAVAGRVVDQRGRPITNAWLEASWPESEGGPAGSADANGFGREGSFRITGIPETAVVTLEVQRWDADERSRRITGIRAGTEDVLIEFGGGLAVEGFVVDAQGKPFADVSVEVATSENDEDSTWVSVQPDGTFRATGLAPGPVWLRAQRQGGGPSPERIRVEAPATKVRIVMPPTAPILGRVVGAPGSGWRVWAWIPHSPEHDARAKAVQADGRFEIHGAGASSEYMVGARSRNNDDDRYALVGPVAAGSKDVTLELKTGRSIEGVLVMPSGSPPAARSISVQVDAEDEAMSWRVWTRSDAQGRFVVRGLPPGRYRIECSLDDGQRLSARREGVQDGTRDVKLVLAPTIDGD